MQKESVKAFKRDLANYQYKKDSIKILEDKIEECYDKLGGVRSVDPSREPIHSPPDKDFEYMIRDRIEALERKRKRLCDQTEEVEQLLGKIENPVRMAVIEVYQNGNTIRSQAEKLFLSESGLRKRMNKAIEKALLI